MASRLPSWGRSIAGFRSLRLRRKPNERSIKTGYLSARHFEDSIRVGDRLGPVGDDEDRAGGELPTQRLLNVAVGLPVHVRRGCRIEGGQSAIARDSGLTTGSARTIRKNANMGVFSARFLSREEEIRRPFLVATKRLYKRVCPSVRPSVVRPSVGRSVRWSRFRSSAF